jgi:hypothetical protein
MSEGWVKTILGGAIAAVLAGLVLFRLLPTQSQPVSQDTAPHDVVGNAPCNLSDGRPGLMETRDGHVFCFATKMKRHTAE